MDWVRVCSSTVLLMMIVAAAVGAVTVIPERLSAYTTSDPILIEGNTEFIKPHSGVTGGSGTIDDPYIIEGWEIDCGPGVGIAVYNTTDYFIIRSVNLYADSGAYCFGVEFKNVLNGAFENSVLTSVHTSIVIESCVGVRIANSTVTSDMNGLLCTDSTRVTVSNCDLTLPNPLYIFDSDEVLLSENTISDAWLAGTIDGCENVSIVGNSVTYSDWDSIQITGCTNLTISENDLWNNGYSGVTLEDCANASICSNNFTGSGYGQGTGIRMFGMRNCNISDNEFSDHGIAHVSGTGCVNITMDSCEATSQLPFTGGVSFSDSVAIVITNITMTGSSDGIIISGCDGVTVVDSTVATSRTNGMEIRSSDHALVANNMVTGPWNMGIYIDSVPNLSIESNEVSTVGYGGIFLTRSYDPNTNTRVEGNTITDAVEGIYASMADETNSFAHNSITSCEHAAIVMTESARVDIHENDISDSGVGILISQGSADISSNTLIGNSDGVRFEEAYECTVFGNVFQGGGIVMTGAEVDDFASHDIDQGNTVNGLPLVYRANRLLLDFEDALMGQLILANCSYVSVDHVTVGQTDVAVQLYHCDEVTVAGCDIYLNSECGMIIGHSSDIEITENNLSENGQAISLMMSEGVRTYHNNFVDNSLWMQVWDDNLNMNAWDDGYPGGGNFWSDLEALDLKSGPKQDMNGSDAISDHPYTIGAVEFDMYPLMIPWGEPQPPIAIVTWCPQVPRVGETVFFNASASGDRDGVITTYEWDFGDGSTFVSTQPTAENEYLLEGNYSVSITVTDDDGLTHLLSFILTVESYVDEEPPTTSLSFTGTEGDNGWYVSSVQIVLASEDDDLSRIVYRLDEGDWIVYTDSFNVTESGVHILEYYSKDTAGNLEGVQSREIMIDRDPPELAIDTEMVMIVGDSVNITWSCLETASGIALIEYSVDDGAYVSWNSSRYLEVSGLSDGEHTVTIRVYDKAGNSANIFVTFAIDTTPGISSYLLPVGLALVALVCLAVLTTFALKRRNAQKPPEQ